MFYAADKILKKLYAKKDVFRRFLESLNKKLRFFGARSPLKFSVYWRQTVRIYILLITQPFFL